MLKKLHRDKVISIVDGKDLVGVYVIEDGKEILLGEMSPKKADKIIKLWDDTLEWWVCPSCEKHCENKEKFIHHLIVESPDC